MPYKDPAKQKAYNAKRQAAHRAKQKAKLNPSSPSNTSDESEGAGDSLLSSDEGLDVDVIAEEQLVEEKLSFFQRTMQKLQASPDAPVKRRGKKSKENLLVTALPTVLASLICTYATQMLPEEYAACAPTQGEISGIITPLMEIIGRRVEIAGKVNQDASDIISSLICAILMGARMYVTFVDIKKASPQHAKDRQRFDRSSSASASIADSGNQPVPNFSGGARSYQAASQGIVANGASHDGVSQGYADAAESDASSNGADAFANLGTSEPSDAEKVAALFKRDIVGRQQLGLLPVRV